MNITCCLSSQSFTLRTILQYIEKCQFQTFVFNIENILCNLLEYWDMMLDVC